MPATNGSEPVPAGGHSSQAGAVLAGAALAADAPEALLRPEAEVRAEPTAPVVDAVALDRPLDVEAVDRVAAPVEPAAPDWLTAAEPAAPTVGGVVVEVVEFGPDVLDGAGVVPVEPVGVEVVCAAAGIGRRAPSRALRHAAPR